MSSKSTCIPQSLNPGSGEIGDELVDKDDEWPIRIRSEWFISWLKSSDEHWIAVWLMEIDERWSAIVAGLVNSSWIIFNNLFFLLLVGFCCWGIVDEWSLKEFEEKKTWY